MPVCLHAVAACALLVQDAEKIALSHPLHLHCSHQLFLLACFCEWVLGALCSKQSVSLEGRSSFSGPEVKAFGDICSTSLCLRRNSGGLQSNCIWNLTSTNDCNLPLSLSTCLY